MRKLAKLLPYFIIVLLLAIAAMFFLRSGPFAARLKETIVQELQQRTGRKVAVRELTLTGPGRVTLRDVTIANPDGTPLLSAPEVTVRAGHGGVLERLRTLSDIREIVLRRPTVRVVRRGTGAFDISDLFRHAQGKVKFTGKVVVEDGTLTFVDEARRGQVTALQHLDLTSATDAAGKTSFSVSSSGASRSFATLEAKGEHEAATGLTTISGRLADLDAVFAQKRLPRTKAFSLLAGRGDVTGTVTVGPPVKPAGIKVDITMEARGLTLAFPWLARPVAAKSARLRLNGEQLTLECAAALVEGAPVTLRGTVTGFRNTRLDLAFTASGLRQAQLKALFPHLALPPTLSLPAPIRLEATARGVAPDIAISGRANTDEVVLSCVSWHDFTTDFRYTRGQVTLTGMHAHGSPRQLEGDLQAVFGPGGKQQTKANLVLRDVPLKLLAGCTPALGALDVSGTATLTIRADLGTGGGMTGSFTAHDVGYRGYALGSLSGNFTSLGPLVRVTGGRIAGPTAAGTFSLTAARGDAYDLTADLASLRLSALGVPAGGVARGSLRVAGSLKTGGAGRVSLTTIGPGAIRAVSADLRIAPREMAFTNLVLQPERGQITGEVKVIEGARLGGRLQLTEVALQDWLPLKYLTLLPAGAATGTIALGGTLSSPSAQADLSIADVTMPALGQGTGRLRARYASGALSVEELTFENQGNRITLQGEYSPRRGLDLRLSEAQTDLAMFSLWTQPLWGVSASGPVTVSATVRGQVRNPEVTFRVVSLAATINGQAVQNLTLIGSVRKWVLTLDTASLRQGAGRLDLRGTVDLPTRRTNLHLAVSQIDLAVFSPWTRRHLGLDPSGLVTAEASLSGPPRDRKGSFTITSAAATVNGLPLTNVELDGELSGGVLTLGPVTFRQEGGTFTASGTVDLNSQQLSLAIGLNAMDISRTMLAFAQAASRLSYFGTTDQLLRAYTTIPGPLGGTLTAALQVSGTYRSPKLAADFSLERLSFRGGAIDSITGSVEVAFQNGAVRNVKLLDLLAGQAEALAQAKGEIVPGGEISLRVEINYLDLAVLAPWFKALAGVGGRATVSFDVSGRTGRPVIVGSAFIDAPSWGPLKLEAATAYPITVQGDVLKIEDLRLRYGPMQGTGRATIPLRITYRPLRVTPLPTATADLSITGGEFAPIIGMTAAQFDAEFHLAGGKLIVQKSAEEGSPDSKVAGIRGHLGSGEFTVSGDVTLPPSYALADLPKSRFNLTADLDPVDLVIPDFITAKLHGRLLLRNAESGEPLLENAAGAPLVMSAGNIGVPPSTASFAPANPLPFAPKLAVRVVAGNDLWFRYKPVDALLQPSNPADAQPASYVDIGGKLTVPEVTVYGEVRSRKGELSFPNARLELTSGRARLERNPNQPMRVRILEAEATGTVGDYQIVLSPTGQVYPAACYDPECVPLDLGIRTTPYLDPAYALALLVGPVVAPTVRAGPDALSVLSAVQRPTPGAGALTGFMLPSLGSSIFGLDYAFEGPLRLRVRERLFGRVFVTYLSPLTGSATTRRLSLNYQVTPRYFIGASIIWSATSLTQYLYLVNRSWTF